MCSFRKNVPNLNRQALEDPVARQLGPCMPTQTRRVRDRPFLGVYLVPGTGTMVILNKSSVLHFYKISVLHFYIVDFLTCGCKFESETLQRPPVPNTLGFIYRYGGSLACSTASCRSLNVDVAGPAHE